MKTVQPVSLNSLTLLISENCALCNALYRNAPLQSGSGYFVFEPIPAHCSSNTTSSSFTSIEFGITNGDTESIVFLELLNDSTDTSWQNYEGDVRLVAWSVSHDSLLAGLDRALLGNIRVAKITDHDQRQDESSNRNERASAQAIEFALYRNDSFNICRGRLWGCETLISEESLNTKPAVTDAWLDLPMHIPITLSALEIDLCDLSTLEPGGLIRLDSSYEELFKQLSLTCGEYGFVASADTTSLQILATA